MRAALYGAGWVAACVALSGLVALAAALHRARHDDDWADDVARGYETGGIGWLLQEVAGQ
jgi:hypothetical protein